MQQQDKATKEYVPVAVYVTALQEEITARAKLDAHEILEHLSGTAPTALKRLNELVQSDDENVAGTNARYIVDHLIGKATQKSVSTVTHVNIDVLAD